LASAGAKEPRDLKLKACLESFQGFGELPVLKTAALRPVGAAYERNIRRVYTLIMFPLVTITSTVMTQKAIVETQAQLPSGATNDEVGEAVKAALNKAILKREEILGSSDGRAQRLMDAEVQTALLMLKFAVTAIEDGAEAWLAAQVTGTWTAFEAMSEDLWEAALNTKPRGLAELTGKSKRLRSDTANDPSHTANSGEDKDKGVRLNLLQKYDYNLSSSMGTILKGKYGFDRLEGIRRAYAEAFSKDSAAIDKVLNEKTLDALSVVRNNLVHNGGIVDSEYLRRSKDLPAEAIADENSPIPLDGELVVQLIGPVMKHGHDLVVAVDDWLAAH
jgi:hypothetical protein